MQSKFSFEWIIIKILMVQYHLLKTCSISCVTFAQSTLNWERSWLQRLLWKMNVNQSYKNNSPSPKHALSLKVHTWTKWVSMSSLSLSHVLGVLSLYKRRPPRPLVTTILSSWIMLHVPSKTKNTKLLLDELPRA